MTSDTYDLTPRQIEILNLVGRGLSNRDIGEVLGISINTVKVHIGALMSALDVSNRTEAVFIYERLKQEDGSPMAEALALAGSSGRPTIAVLPLELAGAADLDHLSKALSEDLIARIGVWKWFPVIGYGAVAEFAGRSVDPTLVREKLGAQYCVTGRIRHLASALRVTVELIHVPDGAMLWSDQFDGDTLNLFDFIDTTARRIVGQMAPELLRRDAEHAASRSFPAWNEASRAMWHVYVGSREHSAIAAEAWEQAIELDPNMVFAWYAKAAGLYQRVFDQWSDDPRTDMAEFVKAAERCVALDITDSAAQEICGFARLVTGRLDDAIVHLERAVALNPSNAQATASWARPIRLRAGRKTGSRPSRRHSRSIHRGIRPGRSWEASRSPTSSWTRCMKPSSISVERWPSIPTLQLPRLFWPDIWPPRTRWRKRRSSGTPCSQEIRSSGSSR
jgi:TolB-like protein/DNA-binding CsgD family transcriptional regulator